MEPLTTNQAIESRRPASRFELALESASTNLRALAGPVRAELLRADIPLVQTRLALRLVTVTLGWSRPPFARGRQWVVFSRLEDAAGPLGLSRSAVHGALFGERNAAGEWLPGLDCGKFNRRIFLAERFETQRKGCRAGWLIVVFPHSGQWNVDWLYSRACLAAADEQLCLSGGQFTPSLPTLARVEDLFDALAATSVEEAIAVPACLAAPADARERADGVHGSGCLPLHGAAAVDTRVHGASHAAREESERRARVVPEKETIPQERLTFNRSNVQTIKRLTLTEVETLKQEVMAFVGEDDWFRNWERREDYLWSDAERCAVLSRSLRFLRAGVKSKEVTIRKTKGAALWHQHRQDWANHQAKNSKESLSDQ